jgi:Hemerythrin HHE cation binding domain
MPRHPSLVPLSHDHRDALALAFFLHHPAPPGRVSAMTPTSTPSSRRTRMLAFFEDNLQAHLATEEEVLFPALSTDRPLIDALVADHRRLEALRDGVRAAVGDVAVDAALTAFADLLERHVRSEERDLFAHFPGAMDAGAAAALGVAIRARRTAAGGA